MVNPQPVSGDESEVEEEDEVVSVFHGGMVWVFFKSYLTIAAPSAAMVTNSTGSIPVAFW